MCLFLARMAYVLPTSIFGFVFVAQRPEFEIPVFDCLVLLLGLFALFCYVREPERLAGFSPAEKASTGAGPKVKALEGKRLALI
jgi:hypothetical protein